MNLARIEPMNELRRMHEDVDRLMGNLISPLVNTVWPVVDMAGPPVDVYEKDGNVIMKAELPGLCKDDIEITATEDGISLKGEFKTEEETKKEGYIRRERREGKFFRTIAVPAAIKPDEVKASFKDGVLEVTAPLAQEIKPKERKVPIDQ